MRQLLFRPSLFRLDTDIGLLVLRLCIGGFMVGGHGIPKLMKLPDIAATFADPLGIGPTASLVLALFAEIVCAITLMAGFLTRFSAFTLFINMVVIVLIVHQGEPWGELEFPLLYTVPFLALALTGAGRLSADAIIAKKLGIGA